VARFRELKKNNGNKTKPNKGCMCHHIVALPFTLKSMYLKAKEEELWKLKIFHHAKKKKNLPKKSSKSKQKSFKIYYYNFVSNLKFQHKSKNIIFSKILI
jgi:hypothetical protein